MKYSWTKRLLLQGLSDGSIVIRPTQTLETFVRNISHSCEVNSTRYQSNLMFISVLSWNRLLSVNTSISVSISRCINSGKSGVSAIALSFDDKYVISAGNDGLLVVQHLRLGEYIHASLIVCSRSCYHLE